MLKAAHAAKRRGIDVVVGYVEPHPRPRTAALLKGLEILPNKQIPYHNIVLKEFDLDNYLFGITESELSDREIKQIKHQLKQEMMEIFYGRNLPSVKA